MNISSCTNASVKQLISNVVKLFTVEYKPTYKEIMLNLAVCQVNLQSLEIDENDSEALARVDDAIDYVRSATKRIALLAEREE